MTLVRLIGFYEKVPSLEQAPEKVKSIDRAPEKLTSSKKVL